MNEGLMIAALWVLIALGAAFYISHKGHSWQLGLIVGLLLGPGVILVLVLVPDERLSRLLRKR
jgi:hypothetical protein